MEAEKDTSGIGNKDVNKKSKLRTISRIFKLIGIVFAAVLVLGAGLFGWLSITEYKPGDIEAVEAKGEAGSTLKRGEPLSLLCWNIGYGALGDNADFFMDGGSSVMTADEERLQYNLDGILSEAESLKPDLLLLQEIDEDSKRSHHVDETQLMRERFGGFTSAFAYNFKVACVPYPMPPIGKVNSGIMTLSRYPFAECTRMQLPIAFSWPVSTANLKRCLLVTRIPIEDSAAELVLINLHLEAYDDGEGKIAQTEMLVKLLNEEYKKGNYVIACGDFNQIFSSEDQNIYPLLEGTWHPGRLDIRGVKGSWSFLMDESTPSCRSLDRAYAGADKEGFQFYLIDGYIVSGNISVDSYETVDLDFKYSDHNPVALKATLN